MTIESIKAKNDRLLELKMQQLECTKQAMNIALKGASKYPKVTLNRAFRVVGWAMKARLIQEEIKMVTWQPTDPGLPIVGEVLDINRDVT